MTVVVGILNKKGVAISADSATTNDMTNNATGENEKKVVNSGNKMLRLSDKTPISIMIVDSALLVGIPWDVIIRWYRKQLGDRQLSTVEEAKKDFMKTIGKQAFFLSGCQSNQRFNETTLVFAGYGAEQEYPQLEAVLIKGISEEDNIDDDGNYTKIYNINYETIELHIISDSQPAEICYFGQTSIAAALTNDTTKNKEVDDFCKEASKMISNTLWKKLNKQDFEKNKEKMVGFCKQKLLEIFQKDNEETHQVWLNSIENYSLKEMADLAKNLINFTELYHKIMCLDGSVGGLIDLAVITREDGFQWLNRKSWYDPSRGGQYGKLGI